MAFGVRDERRVTRTLGTQTGWCLWSVLRYGPAQLRSKLFSSDSIWDISWWTGVQQLLMQLPAGVGFPSTSHSFPLCSLFTSSALTVGPDLIPIEDEPSDFGRSCKWSWDQKLFEAEIVLDFYFFFFAVPICAAVKKKKKRKRTDIIWSCSLQVARETCPWTK